MSVPDKLPFCHHTCAFDPAASGVGEGSGKLFNRSKRAGLGRGGMGSPPT